MKNSSPRKISIFLGLVSAAFAVGSGLAVHNFNDQGFLLSLLFVALLVFFMVYLIISFSLNQFIIEKIRPIYKTIFSVRQTEEKLTEIEDRDLIRDVQNDVMQWARVKTKEIAQLRQLEKYRREFLGNVSHELKTPVFNIQGYISTLLDGGINDKSINKKYLERAEKSVNRLISILNDLESISGLESGEFHLDYTKFDIIRLAEEVFEEHDMLAQERNIKLKINHSLEKPLMVFADRRRIMEALNNLIVNSIKYGRKGGGNTIVGFMDMGDNIVVEIADDGIGISEKDLPRIFERFYRTDKSRSREMGGTGLGLSIVKHIIEAHQQTINVQSKPDVGTSFAFTLQKA